MQQKRIRKQITIVLLVCMCICQAQSFTFNTVFATESAEVTVAVEEIDLGDYQSQMTVGEKQLLSVTVLPMDATNQEITYSSGDSSVAKINGMGRITALKAGVTEIAISCGGITEKFGLTVVEADATVRDIDLGDCPSELEIGASQLLTITVIPEDASGQAITYQSSDTNIATVNELGRVTGIKEGTVTITVSCGNVKKDFQLKVVKAKDDKIPVTDIEIGDYEEELEVDKMMTLSATVIPSDATDATVTYKSSNKKIATVNSSGEVKGIAEGNVTITISAGDVKKKVKLKVKVATSKIELDTTYLVLQSGESHQLSARVLPAEADQAITYVSLTPDVVTVTGGGLVSAQKCGTGTILVKNSDTSTAVTVIVNSGNVETTEEIVSDEQEVSQEYPNIVTVEECRLITSDMLQYYYENNEDLVIYGSGYSIKLIGKDIRNWENELYTNLEFKEESQGVSFHLNRCKKICGEIILQIDEDTVSGKYVYLYNTSKNKYELLSGQDVHLLKLDKEGTYLITDKKLSDTKVSWILIVLAFLFVLVLIVVYIVTKKRYWFW